MSEDQKRATTFESAPPSSLSSKQHNGQQLPDHLIALSNGQWALWHWAALRGAGFPSSLPLRLASSELGAAADHLLEVEDAAKQASDKALDALRLGLDIDDAEKQAELRKARRALKKDRIPDLANLSDEAKNLIEEYRQARSQIEGASSQFREAFDAALEQVSVAIDDIVEMSSFREAVIWQNRHAFQTGIKTITRKPEGERRRHTKQRQHEELVASYLQRYCLKNDTIGFFGPVGWAKLKPDGDALRATPGQSIIAKREVYFEAWCVDALAKSLSADKQLLPWIAPRRIPPVYLDGNMLYLPFRPPSKIPEKQALVLHSCDGERTAHQLALDLIRSHSSLFKNEAEIYQILDGLNTLGMISWTLEVPIIQHPEWVLRQQLERVADERLRAPAMSALDELEHSRQVVAASTGDAEALNQAFSDFESTFTRLTAQAPTRNEGKTYAARTLIYEDCRRDIDLEIGPEVIQALEPPMMLLLASARWFTFHLAEAFRQFCKEIYTQIVEMTGSQAVSASHLVNRATNVFLESKSTPLDKVAEDFQQRWAKILACDEGERRVRFTSEELFDRVKDAFDAPHAGWTFARYHSPDVMISARNAEAIRNGDYQLVLGELHQAANTLVNGLWSEQHPAKEELMMAIDRDLTKARLVPIRTKSMQGSNSRTILGLYSSRDHFLAIAPDAFGSPQSRTVPIGSLVVDNSNGELFIKTRDGRLRFEIIEALGSLMSPLAGNNFKLLPPRAHYPRINIDRLVVNREVWRIPASEISFAFEKDEAARFLAARRWAKGYGMPRHVFARTPIEVKPFYVDFSSPVYVNLFAKMIRRTAESEEGGEFAISEMLPSVDEMWLPDNKGEHYASELRIVALDLLIQNDAKDKTGSHGQ